MDNIHVREANSEILIFLDKHYSTKLSALEEAAKILRREVIHETTNPSSNDHWESHNNKL